VGNFKSRSVKGKKMRMTENKALKKMFRAMRNKVIGEHKNNVEGYRRTTSLGKMKKHRHGNFILRFEWEMSWTCITDGRNKATVHLHERDFVRSSR
jgi:hypothetical protein